MELDTQVLSQLRRIVEAKAPERTALDNALRLVAKWRSVLIQNTVIQQCGTAVQSGPFKGMQFVNQSSEGCHVPKLLGIYEQELHPHIEAAVARGYGHVIVIGMAEGYYAVGLAMRMPDAKVHAFDTNEKAHAICRKVAELNKVADRVEIGGLFKGEDFARYAGDRLVICDIEGAEEALLDPQKYPALRDVDLIVELHECFKPDITRKICARFEASHDIAFVPHGGRDVELPEFFQQLGHLDQLLSVWEWRTGPTPWAVMLRKA
jgi:hypothetical protein